METTDDLFSEVINIFWKDNLLVPLQNWAETLHSLISIQNSILWSVSSYYHFKTVQFQHQACADDFEKLRFSGSFRAANLAQNVEW